MLEKHVGCEGRRPKNTPPNSQKDALAIQLSHASRPNAEKASAQPSWALGQNGRGATQLGQVEPSTKMMEGLLDMRPRRSLGSIQNRVSHLPSLIFAIRGPFSTFWLWEIFPTPWFMPGNIHTSHHLPKLDTKQDQIHPLRGSSNHDLYHPSLI